MSRPSVRFHVALVSTLVALWTGAVLLGLVQRLWDETRTRPPSTGYDKAFRDWGGTFVALAFSLRMALARMIGQARSLKGPSSTPGMSVTSVTSMSLAFVYSGHAALRALLYKLHVHLIKTKAIAGHIMSDHILLSSCVLTGLLCELYIISREAVWHRGRRRAVLYVFALLLVAAIVGLAMQVYATARYFHDWSDSLVAVGLGGIFKWTAWRTVGRD